MSEQNNTVDSMLPIPKLFAYGLQHVLSMYAGAVAGTNHLLRKLCICL